jgi:hypothetical protein
VNSSLAKRVRFQAFGRSQRGTKARLDRRYASVQPPEHPKAELAFLTAEYGNPFTAAATNFERGATTQSYLSVAQRYQGPKNGLAIPARS